MGCIENLGNLMRNKRVTLRITESPKEVYCLVSTVSDTGTSLLVIVDPEEGLVMWLSVISLGKLSQ